MSKYKKLIVLLAILFIFISSCSESIHYAAKKGNRKKVESILLKNPEHVNAKSIGKRKYTPLHSAVSSGQTDIVELLIEKGADVNAADEDGGTPLVIAIGKKDLKIARILIANGADVDKGGISPLLLAIYPEQLEMVKLLVANDADLNITDGFGSEMSVLHMIAFYGEVKIAKLLIAKGAEVNARDKYGMTPLFSSGSCMTTNMIIITRDVESTDTLKTNWTKTHHEVSEKCIQVAELLIENGADVNTRADGMHGFTPLHYITILGHADLAKLLIDNGAEVNSRSKHDHTPLHSAVGLGRIDTVRLLIAHGADVNAKTKSGKTPLHSAAAMGHVEIAKMLILNGAEVNAKNQCGDTPLHLTTSECGDVSPEDQQALVELLIANGADINARNDDGETPLKQAKKNNNRKVAKLLRQHGGVE